MVKLRNSQPHVRIVAMPEGEAPADVRRQWIGLVLPLAPGLAGTYELHALGVCSGQPQPEKAIGYYVRADDAVSALAEQSPTAAEWWRTQTPHLFGGGHCLVFEQHVCEYLPDGPD